MPDAAGLRAYFEDTILVGQGKGQSIILLPYFQVLDHLSQQKADEKLRLGWRFQCQRASRGVPGKLFQTWIWSIGRDKAFAGTHGELTEPYEC